MVGVRYTPRFASLNPLQCMQNLKNSATRSRGKVGGYATAAMCTGQWTRFGCVKASRRRRWCGMWDEDAYSGGAEKSRGRVTCPPSPRPILQPPPPLPTHLLSPFGDLLDLYLHACVSVSSAAAAGASDVRRWNLRATQSVRARAGSLLLPG